MNSNLRTNRCTLVLTATFGKMKMKTRAWVSVTVVACLLLYVVAYFVVTSDRRNPGYAFIPGHESGEKIITVEFHGEMIPIDNTLYALFWPLGLIEELLTGHKYENDVNHEIEIPEQGNAG